MERISEKLSGLPKESGVYIMKDVSGAIIYVGKAKSLKSRVSQYFQKNKKDRKVEAMVEKIADFDYIITPTERDALALENNLIKKHQPFYNILLKDSKTFPYIKIFLNTDFPRFEVTRKVKNDGAKYFGPYIGVSAYSIVKIMNDSFLLRSCKLNITEGKKAKRECLNHSIGLCSAPCTSRISKADYSESISKALAFLKGDSRELIKILNGRMEKASENLNFENAILARDQLKTIQLFDSKTVASVPKNQSKDAIYLLSDGLASAISVVILRAGKIMGVSNFSVTDGALTSGDLLFNFINQYYEDKILPDDIILSHELETPELLEQSLSKKSFVYSPKGVNLKLLNMAKRNAEEHLKTSKTKEEQKYTQTYGALKLLKERLALKNLPSRIECFDISNTSGTNKVSSMVVFVGGEPKRAHYRKFKIKTVEGSNDYASHQETLSRRLNRLQEGLLESFKEKPDLIIIDGGKGQLSSTLEVLENSSFKDIEIIALAERIEEVFKPNSKTPILLTPHSAELKLLQRIRDESHRFAITFHRATRTKAMLSSELDGIKGLGKVKTANLLKAMKTVENIKTASVAELNSVKGIDISLATKIYEHFNKQ